MRLQTYIVTIDAMGTQKEIAKKIIRKKADYILQVKGNQQTLMDDITEYFEKDVFTVKKGALEESERYHKDMCGDHGRIENKINNLQKIYKACVYRVDRLKTTCALS